LLGSVVLRVLLNISKTNSDSVLTLALLVDVVDTLIKVDNTNADVSINKPSITVVINISTKLKPSYVFLFDSFIILKVLQLNIYSV